MPVGKTKDAGWQIGVSRTVALPPEEVWARIEDTAAWLGSEADDVRSFRPLDRMSVGWNGTIVQVVWSLLGPNRLAAGYRRGRRMALSAMMFFWTSVVPAPIEV